MNTLYALDLLGTLDKEHFTFFFLCNGGFTARHGVSATF